MNKYETIMARKNEIMKKAIGIDYSMYEYGQIGFRYEDMMRDHGYPIHIVRWIQRDHGVGGTPLKELKNITSLVR
ncbi:MAG: PLP-dependent lyase/thiolase, partial [Bacilli bacterium]